MSPPLSHLYTGLLTSLSPPSLIPRFGHAGPHDPHLAHARGRLRRWGAAIKILSNPIFTTPIPGSGPPLPTPVSPNAMIRHGGIPAPLAHQGEITPQGLEEARRLLEEMTALVHEAVGIDCLVRDVCATVDGLEHALPMVMPMRGRRAILVEMGEVEDEMEEVLRAAGVSGEGWGAVEGEGVDENLEGQWGVEGGNTSLNITVENAVQFMTGNVWSEGVAVRGFRARDKTVNSMDTLMAGPDSKIHVGNVYGGRSLWDF